jgi:hypothetical protein
MERKGQVEVGKSKLLVLLLGGRPPGMFFLAAHLRPALIALIASRDSEKAVPEVEHTLQRMLPGARFMDLGAHALVPPYRVAAVCAAIQYALAAAPDSQPNLSVTGAPVPMSIAAYQAAQAADCPVYYVNTNDGEIINLLAPDQAAALEIHITVADYLALYDLAPDKQHQPPGSDVGGHWLEYRVLETARRLRHAGKPLYNDCQQGVRFQLAGANREIDFIGIHAGMVLIASCKTGKDARSKAHLDELEAVAKKLGGDYCVRLYVTDQARQAPPPNQTDPWEQFLAQAHSARIVVVTSADLSNLGEILTREMLTPTYPRR